MDVLGWDDDTLQAQAATLQRVLIFRGTQPCGDPVTPKRAHGCRLDVPTAEKPRRSLGGTEGARPSVATPRHASPGVAKAAASPAACPRSQWATSAARWQKCTPMGPKMGSWLAARTSASNGKLWGVGCKACRWASMSRPIVLTDPSVQPHANFRRHAHSISHREACALYLRHLANSDSKPNTAEPHRCVLHAAPCREDFKAAWVALRTGSNSLRRSPEKARSIQWCLYEAPRDWELRFLQAAGCINMALDERNGRLLVKYIRPAMPSWRCAGAAWRCSETAGAPHKMLRPQCSTASNACALGALPIQEHIPCKQSGAAARRPATPS